MTDKPAILDDRVHKVAQDLGITPSTAIANYIAQVDRYFKHLHEVGLEQKDGSFRIPTPLQSVFDRWEQVSSAATFIWLAAYPDPTQFEMVDQGYGGRVELRQGPFRDLSSLTAGIQNLNPIERISDGLHIRRDSSHFLSRSIGLILAAIERCLTPEELGPEFSRLSNAVKSAANISREDIAPEDLIPVSAASEIVSRDKSTIKRWISNGILTSYRLSVDDPHLVSEAELRTTAKTRGAIDRQ